MEENELNEVGLWLNSQGYDIDLKDHFWMEEYIFGEHKIKDIAKMLVDYECRNNDTRKQFKINQMKTIEEEVKQN